MDHPVNMKILYRTKCDITVIQKQLYRKRQNKYRKQLDIIKNVMIFILTK